MSFQGDTGEVLIGYVTECTIVSYDNPAATSTSKWVLMDGARNPTS